MFTEHVGNLQSAKTLEELKQVLEQVLGDCEAALTHDGSLRINGALPAGATGGVFHVSNGYIAPADGDTEPDANGELPNGWAHIVGPGGAWFQGQVRFDKVPVGDGIDALAALPAGSVIMWAGSTGSIPTGWALMDGTANASGSGIDMRGMIPYAYSGAGDFSTIGGSIAVALATTFSGTGNVTTSSGGAHNHEIDPSDIAGAISAHAGSSAFSTGNNGDEGVSFTPGLVAEDLATGSDIAVYLWPVSGGTPTFTMESHTHAVSGANVASVLDNHTGTGGNIETGEGGAHTHTASISTIAAGLSINTPSTVRTPGKVLAFIEKLP